MTKKILFDSYVNGVRIKIEEHRAEGVRHPYPLRPQTWYRAIRLMKQHGAEHALELIDQRAWRAYDRGDGETSRRWRDLIIAIHAMEKTELLPGERPQ